MNREKELKRMKRRELLELLLEVTKENETLKKTVQLREEQLSSKEITVSKAGSLAEASLQLSGIFEAAQEAADTYLFNLEKANEKSNEIIRSAEQKAAQLEASSQQTAGELLDRARRQAQETKSQAEREIRQMLQQAREQVNSILQKENSLKENLGD